MSIDCETSLVINKIVHSIVLSWFFTLLGFPSKNFCSVTTAWWNPLLQHNRQNEAMCLHRQVPSIAGNTQLSRISWSRTHWAMRDPVEWVKQTLVGTEKIKDEVLKSSAFFLPADALWLLLQTFIPSLSLRFGFRCIIVCC